MKNFPSPKSPTLQATIFVTLSAFVAMLLLSIFMKVEVVAQGSGKFIPQARTQIVQSEFGGRIDAIHVTNGQIVSRGDVLITLDDTTVKTELEVIAFNIRNLEFVRDRITLSLALVTTNEINEHLALAAVQEFEALHAASLSDPSFQGQRGLLEAEANALTANVERFDAEILAAQKAVDLSQIEIAQAQESQKIQQEFFNSIETLRSSGTATQSQYLEALEQLQRSTRAIEIAETELEQNQSNLVALERAKESFIKEQINNLSKQQNETLSELTSLRQSKIASERELSASRVLAPTDGIVDQLDTYTVGGVVDVAQELMRIVPSGSDLVFEAVLSNENVAFVESNMKAKLDIVAYPSERYGFLDGQVSKISADAIEVEENNWGFTIQVTPETPTLEFQEEGLQIRPGMTGTVDIITDERRIISYFFAPIIDTVQSSLNER